MKQYQTSSLRIEYIDFIRGLAIFFMILQHAMIFFAENGGENSLLGGFILLLGTAPAAPVFMIIMGLFFMHAKNRGVSYGLIRGIKLIALGYVLNFFRFSIPFTIGQTSGLEVPDSFTPYDFFFSVDILQMAGLSLICMTLIRQFLPVKQIWLLIVLLSAFFSPLLWGLFPDNPVTTLFWGKEEFVFFPFFLWGIYPIIGMYLEPYLFDMKNNKYIKIFSKIGVLLIILGTLLWMGISNEIFIQGDYHRSGPAVHMVILGFVLIWLPFCKKIFGNLKPDALKNILFFWSRNVTVIYFIQWVLYGWGLLLFGWQLSSPLVALGIGCIVGVLSHFLTCTYLKIFTKK